MEEVTCVNASGRQVTLPKKMATRDFLVANNLRVVGDDTIPDDADPESESSFEPAEVDPSILDSLKPLVPSKDVEDALDGKKRKKKRKGAKKKVGGVKCDYVSPDGKKCRAPAIKGTSRCRHHRKKK